MYAALATKLSVVNSVDQFSPAVPMDCANAVQLEVTIFNLTATSLTVEIQGSNDMQNWSVVTTNTGLVVGYSAPTKSTGVGFRYVRLRYSIVGTGLAIVAAGVNTSAQ
ncbi:MAG: hypothetical protein HUU15_19590 [Candidatus Brocadiae bacterium]|nr:hypothetical protein [Candidatus Brocadiia bacterium]